MWVSTATIQEPIRVFQGSVVSVLFIYIIVHFSFCSNVQGSFWANWAYREAQGSLIISDIPKQRITHWILWRKSTACKRPTTQFMDIFTHSNTSYWEFWVCRQPFYKLQEKRNLDYLALQIKYYWYSPCRYLQGRILAVCTCLFLGQIFGWMHSTISMFNGHWDHRVSCRNQGPFQTWLPVPFLRSPITCSLMFWLIFQSQRTGRR